MKIRSTSAIFRMKISPKSFVRKSLMKEVSARHAVSATVSGSIWDYTFRSSLLQFSRTAIIIIFESKMLCLGRISFECEMSSKSDEFPSHFISVIFLSESHLFCCNLYFQILYFQVVLQLMHMKMSANLLIQQVHLKVWVDHIYYFFKRDSAKA
ncbi:hypothetical protein L1987_64428 [Smallanthus sonchifolius]|uniref:Uncharacterized protein n=1 Tax=Smallanthus sonchifolius TaxID=185202 RepID=A0ACB9CFY4_9ASTR|nr:hypothetical protein L1987_64428 [Smallanthus sonchifolius]